MHVLTQSRVLEAGDVVAVTCSIHQFYSLRASKAEDVTSLPPSLQTNESHHLARRGHVGMSLRPQPSTLRTILQLVF